MSQLQKTIVHPSNLRPAVETLIDFVITEPKRAPGSGLCADLDQIARALHRAFELRCLGDLGEAGEAALTVIEQHAITTGLPPLPHCEGCDIKEPFWSENLARALNLV